MADITKFDDPIWEYTLNAKLSIYLPAVRDFWKHIEDIEVHHTGVFPVRGDNIPAGLMYRVTNTPVRSPIKHVQVFPFVPVSYLNLTNVTGGANKMVSRVCAEDKFTIEEFTIVEKSNLPSVYHSGQFVAFVPTEVLNSAQMKGKWVYLTNGEMLSLMQDKVTLSIKQKVVKFI